MELFTYLARPVVQLKGIGEKQAQRLSRYMARRYRREEGPARVSDLLCHLPYDYIDRRVVTPLAHASETVQTLQVRVLKHFPAPRQRSSRPTPYKVQCEDDTGSVMLIFFHGDTRYLQEQLPSGGEVLISGMLQRYDGMWQMTHPDLILPVSRAGEICRLDALYPATEGISSRMLSKWIGEALRGLPASPEWLMESTRAHYNWPSFSEALQQVHRPDAPEDVDQARLRLGYDEALIHQLSLLLLRRAQKRLPGLVMPLLQAPDMETAINTLPFALTDGQRQVLAELDADMGGGERMLRLLQGDVGAGKTVIAALTMLATIRSGYQAAMMAPTEILARQHLQALETLLGLQEVPIIFLAGSLSLKQREEARVRIESSEAALIIGTHALFQESVTFANLGMIVIDEQHRFGVTQRLALTEKALAGHGYQPHLLLMTATPIPRSLQMCHYGDLDVSKLRQKPAGRQAIETRVMGRGKLDELLAGLSRALKTGEKAYWICPLVEASEPADPSQPPLQAAEDRYAALEVCFPGQVGLVHGKMSMEAREPVMQAFKRGDIRILVATTVVEVGVDVPDATIMVIENAERFGLAQLHQLRGRVGRGDKPSRCLLLYSERCSQTARQRLKTMRETQDGFVIAEADLKLRGGGDVLGTRQTGLPEFVFLDVERDEQHLHAARQEAQILLQEDEELQGERGRLIRQLMRLYGADESLRYIHSG